MDFAPQEKERGRKKSREKMNNQSVKWQKTKQNQTLLRKGMDGIQFQVVCMWLCKQSSHPHLPKALVMSAPH